MMKRKNLLIVLLVISAAWIMASCEPPEPRERIVFVTNPAEYYATSGNIGGLAGADAYCQALAELEACSLPGTYKAWLSDASASPSTRFTKDGIFKMVDGTIVADDWSDLTDGSIDHQIDLNCAGTWGQGWVWTNTRPDGTARGTIPEETCNDWHSSSTYMDSFYGVNVPGSPGEEAYWTYTDPLGSPCSVDMMLYCFQQ